MPIPHLSRRQFLVGGCAAGVAGATAVALAQQPWRHVLAKAPVAPPVKAGKGILVVVTLYGGNDGLNTVVPYTDAQYLSGRPSLGYQANQVIPLIDGLGLHPNLKGLKTLWDAKQLAIVRGVGYPNPIRSHFRSMDIWQSGSPATAVATGWLGRWLDATGTDPMRALSVGSTLPLALTGNKQAGTAINGSAITTPGGARLIPAIAALDAPGPDRTGLAARVASSGADLLSVQHSLADLLSTTPTPAPAANSHQKPGTSPSTTAGAGVAGAAGTKGVFATPKAAPATGLAGELDVVARLIKAGAPTKVYHVSMGGFDNHAQEKATHAQLMTQLDAAITGFFGALAGDPNERGVVLMTYSEFGRRVIENASGGTDHGTAGPVFIAGPAVKGGQLYGDEPSLTNLDQGDLRFTTDFRSVYATVLGKVVGVDPKVALDGSFPLLSFV
ncbi:MAG TPA: DUF1501 domain-containing protein [Acidimicrobiales bacterium]|nr:DUF1501 domain-containing protein [Acidimicrobiales bacterium]